MKHAILILLLVLAAMLILSIPSCSDDGIRPGDEIVFPEKDVSFAAHVQPFFTFRCASYGCHEDHTRAGNLSLTSYFTLTERPGVVVPFDSESSLLMQKIDGRLPHPIQVPIIINENQLKGIKTWIDEGAKHN